jgi:hypothetical protein
VSLSSLKLERSPLPPLPHWETVPSNPAAATVQLKKAVRARLQAAGTSAAEVFSVIEARVRAEVDAVVAAREDGASVWPELDYADIAAGRVSPHDLERFRRRGCLVVRNHFDRAQALAWDEDIVNYVQSNHFFDDYRGPGDDFFASVASKPEIYPLYWSRAQMEARQSERMATVQRFLNAQWVATSDGRQWLDPNQDLLYPDRIRRRPPGASSGGLGAHLDPGTLDLWMTAGYQQAFRHLFDGTVESYDPWDAAWRTAGPQYDSSTMCSAFRTFQGWTALSDMDHDQGVLYSVPIPAAMGYLLLRPFLHDVPEDDLCGVKVGRAFPVTERWHALLHEAQCTIPDVRAGDSVWWHCDLIHGVAPVHDQRGWGNVMYIPSAPSCPKNVAYAQGLRHAFLSGCSPADFPAEHYERSWPNRFGPADLNEIGRRALGLPAG